MFTILNLLLRREDGSIKTDPERPLVILEMHSIMQILASNYCGGHFLHYSNMLTTTLDKCEIITGKYNQM